MNRWLAEDPSRITAMNHRRRSKLAQSIGKLTTVEINALKTKYGVDENGVGRCHYCGRRKKVELDHVIPIAGKDVVGSGYAFNFVYACHPCNMAKHVRIPPGTQHSIFDRFAQ